ncbi:MAG: hypothetical protein CK538_02340 [Opitutia bacterium]|nr:DUF547 domain-containing protein [Opitutaceae bacterium]PHX86626.1 MAG: hypothetical protein CK538_02340 [Opitutae bacterium]
MGAPDAVHVAGAGALEDERFAGGREAAGDQKRVHGGEAGGIGDDRQLELGTGGGREIARHVGTGSWGGNFIPANPGWRARWRDRCWAEAQNTLPLPAAKFARWPKADRLALLINLYNAQTLRLIITHYPLESIRSIGALPGAAWREMIVRQGGRIMTLDQLEHKVIRVEYNEPRIHFALVRAAVSCPVLRSEPFTGARLDAQLADQTKGFLATAEINRFDAATGTLYLSPLFKW